MAKVRAKDFFCGISWVSRCCLKDAERKGRGTKCALVWYTGLSILWSKGRKNCCERWTVSVLKLAEFWNSMVLSYSFHV